MFLEKKLFLILASKGWRKQGIKERKILYWKRKARECLIIRRRTI
jgi:hypothetical protein